MDEDFPDDDTKRVRLARVALKEAQGAHNEAIDARRAVHRLRSVWSVLALIVAIAAAGYALRDQVEHFATKERADRIEAAEERTDKKVDLVLQAMQAQHEMTSRMSDQIDKLRDLLMEQQHGRRR